MRTVIPQGGGREAGWLAGLSFVAEYRSAVSSLCALIHLADHAVISTWGDSLRSALTSLVSDAITQEGREKEEKKEEAPRNGTDDRIGRSARSTTCRGQNIPPHRPRYAPAPRAVISTQASVHFENERITHGAHIVAFSGGVVFLGPEAWGLSAYAIGLQTARRGCMD